MMHIDGHENREIVQRGQLRQSVCAAGRPGLGGIGESRFL